MATPARIPIEQVIVPTDGSDFDGWAVKINCDPVKDWTGSTFTVDPAPFRIDDTHKGDTPTPYVLVVLDPVDILDMLAANPGLQSTHWNITEDLILGRTFFTQTLEFVQR